MLRYKHPVSFIRIPLDHIPGKLFASPMPFGPYDKENRLLKAYRHAHVNCVVTLTTQAEIEKKARRDICAVYAKYGMDTIHCPIEDYTAPTVPTLGPLIRKIADRLKAGEGVAVHCNAGVGRTGVVLSATLSELENVEPEVTLERLHQYLAIDITDEQRRLVNRWWDQCHRV